MESQWRSAAFSFLTHSIIKVIDLLHKNIARGKIQSRNRPVILEVRKIVRCQAARECAHPSTERCSRRLRIKWRQECPLWELVERADVERLASQTWQLRGKREEPGQALFRLFVFDRWMEIFGITS